MIVIKKYYELYLDCDSVLYNLSKLVIEHYNLDFKDNYDHKQNKSYFWEDTKAPLPYFEQLLNMKGMFYNGDVIHGADKVINKLHEEGFKIYFVSLPQWNQYCAFEKVEWLKKHFPWVNPDENIIFTGSKHLLDGKNRIIYDDNIKYLNGFKKGIPICFTQGWNEDWKGYRVDTHKEFYNLVHKLEKKSNSLINRIIKKIA